MGRTNIAVRVAELHRNIHEAEKNKQNILLEINKIKNSCLKGEISYTEYQKQLSTPVSGKTLPEWVNYYDNYIHLSQLHINKLHSTQIKQKYAQNFLVLLSAIFVIFLFNQAFTGFFISNQQENFINYTQSINQYFAQNSEIIWTQEKPGQIQSISFSGNLNGNGKAKIYFENILVLNINLESANNISVFKGLTGFAINEENISSNQSQQQPEEATQIQSPSHTASRAAETNITSQSMESESPSHTNSQTPDIIQENLTSNQSQQQPEEATQIQSPSHTASQAAETNNSEFIFDFACNEVCDLSNYNLSNKEYSLRVELENATLMIRDIQYTIIRETSANSSTLQEITSLENPITIEQTVRWKKEITLNEPGQLIIDIPNQATSISANSIDYNKAKKSEKVTSSDKSKAKELIISGNSDKYEILYETPAPTKTEKIVSNRKKEVTISAADQLNYSEVISFTTLPTPVTLNEINKIKLFWKINGTSVQHPFTTKDENQDGLIEKIEWITPHLSEQTFIIIIITEAEHLDSNRQTIADIYNQVKEQDDVWSENIKENEYVRVRFEIPLDRTKDITIYPRIVSGNPKVEVYEIEGNQKIASFENIKENEYNKVFLTSLQGVQQDFDLKVIEGVLEFDHIIDPSNSQTIVINYSANGTFTVPAGVTSITVEAWGGGGTGGSTPTSNIGGGGGAGGQYARGTVSVSPGAVFTVTIASSRTHSGVANTNGLPGYNTSFFNSSETIVLAVGGAGGLSSGNGQTGGAGSTSGGIGNVVVYRGGNGGTGASASGGGGGGAGSNGNGGDASATTGGTGTTELGGNGPNGATTNGAGTAGNNYSAGGEGSRRNAVGGAGAQGYLRVTYNTPDTLGPRITINNPQNITYGPSNGSIHFNVTLDESGNSCNYSLDYGTTNITMEANSSNTGFYNSSSTISSGSQTVIFYCRDSNNNLNSTNLTFYNDLFGPLIQFGTRTESDGSTTTEDYIIVNVTATDSTSISNITIRLYNSTYDLVNTSFITSSPNYANITSLTNGIYRFNATAYDVFGNVNYTSTYNVTVNSIVIPVLTCTNLDQENGYYQIRTNLNSDGGCIRILANNITLDGKGFLINYSRAGTVGQAISINGYNYTRIKDVRIIEGSTTGIHKYGILLNITHNNSLENVNVSTVGTYGYGIHLMSSSNNTLNNIIVNTTVTGNNYGYGIYLSTNSNNNEINNANIQVSSATGNPIYIYTNSYNNTFNNINISSIGGGTGIYLLSNAKENKLNNISIITTSSSAAGILLGSSANDNQITNIDIKTQGSNSHGLNLGGSGASNNYFSDIKINTSSSTVGTYGIYLAAGTGNRFVNLNITTMTQAISDISGDSATNYLIFNNSLGEIDWTNNANGAFIKDMDVVKANLSLDNRYIQITNNSVFLNSSYYSGEKINSSANITLRGIKNYWENPVILKDGALCTDCYNFTSLNAGTVIFNATSWSNYSIGEGPLDYTPVNSCMSLDITGTLYKQISDVTPSGTGPCINITASNIIFNGNGYKISSPTFQSTAIRAIGVSNITIKNTNISIQLETFANSINLTRVNNSIIANNTIRNSGPLYLENSRNNSIENNTIIQTTSAIEAYNSNENRFKSNNIRLTTQYSGMYIVDSNNTIISDNRINDTSYDNFYDGIYLHNNFEVYNYTITNNLLYNSSIAIYGVSTAASSIKVYNNTLINGTLNTGAIGVYGYIVNADIQNNTILNTSGYGIINDYGPIKNSTVQGNILSRVKDPIYFAYNIDSANIEIKNNTIIYASGIGIDFRATNSTISENNITSTILSTADQISIGGIWNNITNNILRQTTGSLDSIYIDIPGNDAYISENNINSINGINVDADNVKIYKNDITTTQRGILTTNADFVNISDNVINTLVSNPIYVSGTAPMPHIENNTIYAGNYNIGIFTTGGITTPIIKNNKIYNSSGSGIVSTRNGNLTGNIIINVNGAGGGGTGISGYHIEVKDNYIQNVQTTGYSSNTLGVNVSLTNITIINASDDDAIKIINAYNVSLTNITIINASAGLNLNITSNYTDFIDEIQIGSYVLGNSTISTKLTIKKTLFGEIVFLEKINTSTRSNFTSDFIIKNNSVFVNASAQEINKSARITLRGIKNYWNNPVILVDNLYICDETTDIKCSNFTNLNAGTVEFNVSSWSANFSIGEIPSSGGWIDNGSLIQSNVWGCGNLLTENATYILNQSISSENTCFNILANNITLNGNGFNINYSATSQGYGINIENYNYTKIKNITINEVLPDFSQIPVRIVNSYNSLIENVAVSTWGDLSNGFYILQGRNNTIRNSNSTTQGQNAYGVYLENSTDNSLSDINITTYNSDAKGIGFSNSNNSIISNTKIYTAGAWSYGILLQQNSYNNTLDNFEILTAGTDSYGVYLQTNNSDNNLSNFIIETEESWGLGIIIDSNSNNNTFQDIKINTLGSNAYGIYLQSESNNNKFINPNISSSLSSSILDLTGNSYTNHLEFRNSLGQITWTNESFSKNLTIIKSEISLDNRYIQITNNSVSLNSSYYNNEKIKSNANITFYGIKDDWNNPVILKDGVDCIDCYNFTSLNAGTVSFNVTSWSNYSIGEHQNSPPQIITVFPIADQSITENSKTEVLINFTAQDNDEYTDLDTLTAKINLTRTGATQVRQNNTCIRYQQSGNLANYSCTLDIWYFDSAGEWNISVFIGDLQGANATNISTNLTILQTSGFVSGPNSVSFSEITPGAQNTTANNNPIILNNTGNKPITSGNIQINATNLVGETDPTRAIYANNFSVGTQTGGNDECGATGSTLMTRAEFAGLTGATLPRGNHSINDGTGQESLYVCIIRTGSELTAQAYSTASEGSWTIKILIIALSFRRKKKIKQDKLVQLLTLLKDSEILKDKKEKIISELERELCTKHNIDTETLKELTDIEILVPVSVFSTELGALEAISLYLKDKKLLRFNEIARILQRNEKTIWTAYTKAKEKNIEISEKSKIKIPLNNLVSEKITIFEGVIKYLKENESFRYSEIASMLNREQRNIWTIYNRVSDLSIRFSRIINNGNKIEILHLLQQIQGKTSSENENRIISYILEKLNLKKESGDILVPVSVFSTELGALEAISLYLKDKKLLRFNEIARILQRNEKTIWTAYTKAKEKNIEISEKGKNSIPLDKISNSNLTVFESLIKYLRENESFRYSEIASMLNREQRNIWTIYNRVNKK